MNVLLNILFSQLQYSGLIEKFLIIFLIGCFLIGMTCSLLQIRNREKDFSKEILLMLIHTAFGIFILTCFACCQAMMGIGVDEREDAKRMIFNCSASGIYFVFGGFMLWMQYIISGYALLRKGQ